MSPTGTTRPPAPRILVDEFTVFVLCTMSATRAGRHAEFLEVHLWRIVNGRPVEFREFQSDEYTENRFLTLTLHFYVVDMSVPWHECEVLKYITDVG